MAKFFDLLTSQLVIGRQRGKKVAPTNVLRLALIRVFSFLQEASVFVFDKRSVEKLYKPKRKDQVTELLKVGISHLQCYRHPRFIQVLHGPEESSEALTFATEPIIGSLANVLW